MKVGIFQKMEFHDSIEASSEVQKCIKTASHKHITSFKLKKNDLLSYYKVELKNDNKQDKVKWYYNAPIAWS